MVQSGYNLDYLNIEYFTEEEDWYIEKVEEVLENIKENNCIVEVNIKLMSKSNLDAHYPNKMTIKKILKMNIPLTLNTGRSLTLFRFLRCTYVSYTKYG